ncbi:unnamed protein product [Nezara viridula]|uniref:mannose-6-phosphate isomerase n=1 Tax=Nezara viridula TaxID=85310 RepID=A0A9P0MVU8_NEZVI|nr:unnamed protein product [Nezara viridula]
MELSGALSTHPWGKRGSKSMAGYYYWHRRKRNLLDENAHYSTLIFSGNASARPTVIVETKENLDSFIEKNANVIGKNGELYANRLPFQVKIICLESGMSLGCHPPKKQAERLHRMYPGRYSSEEHKPKLLIALHYLQVMAGFRQRSEIVSFISGIPELAIVIPYATIEDYLCSGNTLHLKRMFYFLMSASHQEIKTSLDIFFARMNDADSTAKALVNYNVLKTLFEQFSYDCGVYAPLFLNHIFLNPGQAMFIPSGIVHTCLHGDCFEVTTSSRNIIRCGLTDKYKDIDEFLYIADFNASSVEKLILEPNHLDEFEMSYVPPAKEMQVSRICVPVDMTYTIKEKEWCSIAMVTRGIAILDDFRQISLGTALFILPYQKLTFKVKKDITIYVVFPNPDNEFCDSHYCHT